MTFTGTVVCLAISAVFIAIGAVACYSIIESSSSRKIEKLNKADNTDSESPEDTQ